MEKLTEYNVVFVSKLDPNRDFMDRPVSRVEVYVIAKDISEAMKMAWDAVRITGEDYEIEGVSKCGIHYTRGY